jgi:hypothetical protein
MVLMKKIGFVMILVAVIGIGLTTIVSDTAEAQQATRFENDCMRTITHWQNRMETVIEMRERSLTMYASTGLPVFARLSIFFEERMREIAIEASEAICQSCTGSC